MAAWVNTVVVDLERGLARPNKVTDRIVKFLSLEIKSEINIVALNLYFFSGIVGLLTFSLSWDYGSKLVFTFLGIVYPVYKLMRTIINKILSKTDADIQLLTNWFVFTGFGIIELFCDIPPEHFDLYLILKNIFLLWYFLWYQYRILCGHEYMVTTNNPIMSTKMNEKKWPTKMG